MARSWVTQTAEAGSLLRTLAQVGAPWAYLSVRDSFWMRVALLFADPRCDEEMKMLVREYLSGPQGFTD